MQGGREAVRVFGDSLEFTERCLGSFEQLPEEFVF